jgi:putative membrane protein
MPACNGGVRASRSATLSAAVAGGLVLIQTCSASAHPVGEAATPADVWRTWTLEPGVIALLAAMALVYAAAVLRLRHAPGGALTIQRREVVAFVAGWLATAVALVSPLDAAGGALFSAHMVQHELLMALAAPLLVLGKPLVAMVWALPRAWRPVVGRISSNRVVRPAWAALTRPFDAWLIHGVAIWVWHIPRLFEAALRNEVVHAAQHVSFIASALFFWWAIIHPVHRAARGMSVLYLFTTAVHTGVLGALMTFARTPWYPQYASRAAAWGLTPVGDQQLAGMIMWIPASVVYLVAALLVMRRWLGDSEWSVTQREQAALILSLTTDPPSRPI